MKKFLLPVIMFGVFSFLPIKPEAMVELDENGKVIEKEIKEGEVSILMAPDQGNADQPVSSDENRILSGETDGNLQSTTSSDVVKSAEVEEDVIKTTSEDDLYTTTAEGKLVAEKDDDNSANVPVIIVTSSAVGIALGAGAMYLLKKKNNN